MTHPLLALLALVAPLPVLAPQADSADQQALCQRLADELAAVGAPLDLAKVTVEVLPLSAFRADLEELDALFRQPTFYQAQYLVREALGQEPGPDAEALKSDMIKRRIEASPVHYNFLRDAMVFLEGEPLAMRERLVATELAVAWRDQETDLAAAMELEDRSLEQTLLRGAMIYGEAEALARSLFDARTGKDERLSESQLELAVRARGLDAFWERVRIEGRRFCERRLSESGGREALTHYWSALPDSTEQMLHERKWKVDRPEALALPAWPIKTHPATLVHVDTIGELGIFSMLVQAGVPRAKAFELSVGWDGDLMHVYEVEGLEKVLVWRTVWDRSRDAQQFSRIWRLRTLGEVRVGGRTVDWVFAQEQGPWKKLLVALEENTPRLSEGASDGLTTSEIEEEYKRDRETMPYVVANLWKHPKYELVLPVPIGWFEDMDRGVPFIARTGSGGGFTDTVRVGARSNRSAFTIQELLDQNRAALDAHEERTPLTVEVRQIDGKDVAFLRFRGHDGTHEVIYTTVMFLHQDKQVAITIAVEEIRWPALNPIIDGCLAEIEFGPVEQLER